MSFFVAGNFSSFNNLLYIFKNNEFSGTILFLDKTLSPPHPQNILNGRSQNGCDDPN